MKRKNVRITEETIIVNGPYTERHFVCFLIFKKKCSFLFSVFGCLTSKCFYIPCIHCLWKAEEGAQYPGTEETDNY